MLSAEKIADHGPAQWKSHFHRGKENCEKTKRQSELEKIGRSIAAAAANKMYAFKRGLFDLSANQPTTRVAAMPEMHRHSAAKPLPID